MTYRAKLPPLTRYTFGTGNIGDKANPEHMRCARMAMEAGVWFHTSHAYGNGGVYETLRAAFKESPSKIPKLIIKVDGQGADLLREAVETQLRGLGIERIDIAQLCGDAKHEELQPGRPLYNTMVELKKKGVIGCYVQEIFWRYSPNAIKNVKDDLMDGYIYYLNVVNREVSNELYDVMQARGVNVLGLRAVGGGPENFWGPTDQAAAKKELDAIYERSGCKSKVEFRYRFPPSLPNVKTTIGATSKPVHLQELLDADRDFKPLAVPVVREIEALQRRWFADKGL